MFKKFRDAINSIFGGAADTKSNTTEPPQRLNQKLGVFDTPLRGCEQIVLHGAGMEHYMDALMKLASEDLNFTCTKKEMRDYLIVNRRVYQYKFSPKTIDLVPDPENEHDPNAVKILLDDLHVGFVRASEAAGSVELFESDRVKRVQISIQGGKYKILLGESEYGADEEPLSSFDLERGEAPYSIRIYLDVEKQNT